MLSQLGYVYQSFCYGNLEGGDFGNMIVSKVPFARDPIRHNFGSTSKPHNRCYIKVEFDLRKYGVRNLIIYGTHLDVGSRKKRLAEVQELVSLYMRMCWQECADWCRLECVERRIVS